VSGGPKDGVEDEVAVDDVEDGDAEVVEKRDPGRGKEVAASTSPSGRLPSGPRYPSQGWSALPSIVHHHLHHLQRFLHKTLKSPQSSPNPH